MLLGPSLLPIAGYCKLLVLSERDVLLDQIDSISSKMVDFTSKGLAKRGYYPQRSVKTSELVEHFSLHRRKHRPLYWKLIEMPELNPEGSQGEVRASPSAHPKKKWAKGPQVDRSFRSFIVL